MARTKQQSPKIAEAAPKPKPASYGWIVPALLAIAAVALSLQQIDLTILDLGRHIKNGEIALYGTAEQRSALLHTNYYSYAQPDAPFVNHHWLSGVVFFLVWKVASFEGLSLLHAAVTALAVLIAYFAALYSSHWTIAAPLMALSLPNIVLRAQVRPEAFTNLLIAAFYALLLAWFLGKLRTRWLFATLPALTVLWINLHVGFIFAFLLMGMFGLKALAQRDRLREIALVFAVCAVAALANPAGFQGLLQPFQIQGSFQYRVLELRPLSELWGTMEWTWHQNLLAGLMLASVSVALWRWRGRALYSTTRWPELLLLLATAALAFAVVRNIPIFCLLAVPLLAGVLADGVSLHGAAPRWPRMLAMGLCAAGAIAAVVQYAERSARAGIGLRPGVNATADFLRNNGIHGPVWNDSVMGGYMIFHRFDAADPTSGVFADMRPEAYGDFLGATYQKMLQQDDVWQRLDEQYRFRALVYSLQTTAEGIEESILARVRDPEWAPVYTDYYSLIFVRRIPEHADLISKYLIPREAFR